MIELPLSSLNELALEFRQWDLAPLERYRKNLSTRDKAGEPLPPYIPHVGMMYAETRIVLYATAQNLPENACLLEAYRSHPSETVTRLYRGLKFGRGTESQRTKLEEVPVEPYRCGVLPALAGMFLLARSGIQLPRLVDIHHRVAVTNYYKFSLRQPEGGKTKDLNPNKLKRPDAAEYWNLNDELVRRELVALTPCTILSLRGRQVNMLRRSCANVLQVNDPAWILRGGSGVFGPGQSWRVRAASVGDNVARQLAKGYADQVTGRYKSKRDAVECYLLCYYKAWFGLHEANESAG